MKSNSSVKFFKILFIKDPESQDIVQSVNKDAKEYFPKFVL